MSDISGVLGYYEGPKAIILGARRMRKSQSFVRWDAFTPFPVHTLEEAMGIPRSKLPWIVLCGGFSGFSFAIWFLTWTSAVNYPLMVGGKPLLSWPAFVPIFFELTVLLSAFANLFGMFFLSGLRPFGAPAPFDLEFTDDKFALWIPSNEPGFDPGRLEDSLKASGASSVRIVRQGAN